MSKLYLFAIGGSGSRVLKSLTMLLASGVKIEYEIVPMIIDPDFSNGDLLRTVNLMRLYQEIHSVLDFNNNEQNGFFRNSITALNNDGNYLLPLVGTSGISYEAYLDLSTMSTENQALIRMLFSNANLSSDMNVGFKGNPNIGSVVLNQFAESKEFESFASNFMDGDKVFIISSIFGGTGASGFPLLLKTMRTDKNAALANSPIGAVSLLPYFNLKTDNNSSIQADSFITKAKAALNYYEKNVTGNNTLDDMYYLGDSLLSVYDNNDGGDRQQNDAHLIELLAALSIVDFSSKNQVRMARTTQFHEFGLATTPDESVTFGDFGSNTLNILRKPLSMMNIMNAYLNSRDLEHRVSQKWAIAYNGILGNSFWRSFEYNNYLSFKTEFENWQLELANNRISFKPFRTEGKEDILDIIIGYTPSYSWRLFQKKGCDLIDKRMGDKIASLPKNLNAMQAFLELFYSTLNELCEEKLNF